jgi:RNA polymerase sigma-70 factor (ECF subfamily)
MAADAARGHQRRPLDEATVVAASDDIDPEAEALLADSIGVALLVVLQTLSPAERLAFVLHDMFDLPYAEIAPIVGRTENTAAQLAARARRRVRGKTADPPTDLVHHRKLVDAFLTAARDGDFDALLSVLDDGVVLHVDAAAAGTPTTIRGAHAVATNARTFSANARFAEPALVDGAVAIVVAPKGKLALVLRFAFVGDKITEIHIDADPQKLRRRHLALLD